MYMSFANNRYFCPDHCMLTASDSFWISAYHTFVVQLNNSCIAGPLNEQKKIGTFSECTPKGKCLLLFRLSHKCSFILYFTLLFSLVLCRQKQFSKQFQPWHLLVQCLPQPAIHICSPHKLDPIRWHQTMAYSCISLAQRQGSRTIRKCFFFHYGASDPFKGVYPLSTCQPLFPKGGSAGEVIGAEDNDASGSSVADADALYRAACDKSFPPLYCIPQSWGTDGLDFYLCFF